MPFEPVTPLLVLTPLARCAKYGLDMDGPASADGVDGLERLLGGSDILVRGKVNLSKIPKNQQKRGKRKTA